MGSVINGQNFAREIQRQFTRDFILIGRLPTCDLIGSVPFIMTSLCKQYGVCILTTVIYR